MLEVNEAYKIKMQQSKSAFINSLEETFPSIPLFEDELAEDEEQAFLDGQNYLAFILTMGDFRPSGQSNTLYQSIVLDYYSEDRDDVDENILDIITIGDRVKTVSFVNASKRRLRVAETERFVDVSTIQFSRVVKYEC